MEKYSSQSLDTLATEWMPRLLTSALSVKKKKKIGVTFFISLIGHAEILLDSTI